MDRTKVVQAALLDPRMLVEISVVAAKQIRSCRQFAALIFSKFERRCVLYAMPENNLAS